MPDTSRKRIVIDFDNRHTGVGAPRIRRKGRLSRVLLILFLVTAGIATVVSAVAFFWWQHYKTTPAYSLALLIDAAQREDAGTMEQLINTDKLATNLSSELSQKAASRYGMALEVAARQQVETLVPALLPRVKQTISDEVVNSLREVSPQTQKRPFIIKAIALPYALSITTQNDRAQVTIPKRETELTLERNGQRWQVVGIKDEALVQRLVDQLTADLPPIAPPSGTTIGRPPGSRGKRRRR